MAKSVASEVGNDQIGRVPSDEQVGSHYDDTALVERLARLYDASTPLGHLYRDRMRRIDGLLDGTEGELLDAGCGTGRMLRFLQERRAGQFALTGLDRSESAIGVAHGVVAADPPARLCIGRVEEMPFAAASFDVVLAMGVLEYVTAVEKVLAEVARVMRRGGLAIVTMQNPASPYRWWDAKIWSRAHRRRGGQGASPIVRRLTESDLLDALSAAGLEPVSVAGYNFNLALPPFDARFPSLSLALQRRVERVAERIGEERLRRLAADYIVAARHGVGCRSRG
jgi:ubiquinone/menaquinone biosynthesis C-methylase UbiE